MNSFEYATPTSLKQAAALLSANWGESEVLAGGTDLLGRMKDYVSTPKRVINIKNLPGLDAITNQNRELQIGALVTLDRIAQASFVRQNYPALVQTVAEAASPQIRNMATIGGNLCQRPRCWYYRNGMGLMPKSPDGKSLVLEGDNRYHAILGNDGPAYFVSPSTIAPMLIAYKARLRITGIDANREVELEKFYRTPKAEDDREHDLKPNEIVTHIIVPAPKNARAANYEVRQKEVFDWPLATASVVLHISGNIVQSARVVMGAVAPVPWLSSEAAQEIMGKPVNEETAGAAAAAAVIKARALSQNGYKIKLASVAVRRALLAAAGKSIPQVHTARQEVLRDREA